MIEGNGLVHHRSSRTARAEYPLLRCAQFTLLVYPVQITHFVHPLLQNKTRKDHASLSGLTMCAVARHKQFIRSVCTVRISSSCACDNRAVCKDHVVCGSRVARLVSTSCNPQLSYILYFAHLAPFVVLEGGHVNVQLLARI